MAKNKSVYSGILNEPMDFKVYSESILSQRDSKATKDAVRVKFHTENLKQLFERVVALYAHYKIDIGKSGAGHSLALALASDHVPGFKIKEKNKRGRGAPQKWTEFKRLELYADIKTLSRKGFTDLNACAILTENPIYKERYGGEKKLNLHRRYLENLEGTIPELKQFFDNTKAELGIDIYDEVIISSFALREK